MATKKKEPKVSNKQLDRETKRTAPKGTPTKGAGTKKGK